MFIIFGYVVSESISHEQTNIYFYIYKEEILLFLFTVPFDEDDKDKSVWFLDHDYLENMYGMFKKVNGMYLLLYI